MKERFNRDIKPDEMAVPAVPELDFLLRNEDIADRFDHHEIEAKRFKKRYQRTGISSLTFGYLSGLLLVYHVQIEPFSPLPLWTQPIVVAVSLAALVSLLLLLFQGWRARWLAHRFAAEYLRCGKFQLFLLLGNLGPAQGAVARIEQGVAELLHDVHRFSQSPHTALLQFDPGRMLGRESFKRAGEIAPDLLGAAKLAYRELRVDVQVNHFLARELEYRSALRVINSAGDICLTGGIVLSAWQLLQDILGVPVQSELTAAIVAALALAFFITGASVLVYDRGSAIQVGRDRYQHYRQRIVHASEGLDAATAQEFHAIVMQVEQACAAELDEFCRQNSQASFLL